jgi:formiminotetrahydrofolate cyclodeaminase
MADDELRFADLTVGDFVARLASGEPVPGGGAASALAASLAAALVAMVARLSVGRPKYAVYASTHERAIPAADTLAARFLTLADEDAAAYAGFAAAMKMPRETAAEQDARRTALRDAARAASIAPMEIVRSCHRLAHEVESMAGRSNLNASSDIAVAALLTDAAAQGAAANVLVNLPTVADEAFETEMTQELVRYLAVIGEVTSRAREITGGGKLREPEET